MVDFELTCDRDAERWVFTAQTDAWTAGIAWWWTADGEWIEAHLARSVEAAPDGTADEVRAELDIVSSRQDVSSGSSTAFVCADELSAVFEVRALDNETVTDCFIWGSEPQLLHDVASCE